MKSALLLQSLPIHCEASWRRQKEITKQNCQVISQREIEVERIYRINWYLRPYFCHSLITIENIVKLVDLIKGTLKDMPTMCVPMFIIIFVVIIALLCSS